MNFLKLIFSNKKEQKNFEENPNVDMYSESFKSNKLEYIDDYTKLGLTREVTEEEKEIVSVIASAIFVGDSSGMNVRIKSVVGIDEVKIAAIATISAIATDDHPNSAFRLLSIKEIRWNKLRIQMSEIKVL